MFANNKKKGTIMNDDKYCNQSDWDALIQKVGASGRLDDAERMRNRTLAGYTHRLITGGVRHVAPWCKAPVTRDVHPTELRGAPMPTPAPVSAPAAERTTVSRAPEADLMARIARAIECETDSEDDDDDGNPPPMAAAYAVAADIDDEAMARVKRKWPGANNDVFLREQAEKLIAEEKHARAVVLQRQYENEAIAKNRELNIVGGRFTKADDTELAVRIERLNSVADMLEAALDEREGI